MRPLRLAQWSFVLAVLLTPALRGDTSVSGTISASTTWTPTGSPYVLSGQVKVQGTANPVLTIEPGVTVKFDSGAELVVNWEAAGSVRAVGTSAAPILFTSSSGTAPGSWVAIYLGTAGPTSSEFAHAAVEYGGSSGLGRGGIHVAGGAPTFNNVTFRNNAVAGLTVGSGTPAIATCAFTANSGFGLSVTSGSPTLNATSFTDNADWAVASYANVQLNGLSDLTASGNGSGAKNALYLRAATIDTDRRWYASALPYVLTGMVKVQGSAVPTLTIDPGAVVKFTSGAELLVNWEAAGALQAVGTAAAPILFTAHNSTTPGHWIALYLANATSATSRIEHATVEYAGSAGHGRGGIHVAGSSPTLTNVTLRKNAHAGFSMDSGVPTLSACTITENNGPGARVAGGRPEITSSTISSNSGYGLDFAGGAAAIAATTISNNGDYAIAAPAASQLALSEITATGNGGNARDAVLLRGGTVAANHRWYAAGLPYVVSGAIRIEGSTAPVLTVDAGVTVKFAAGAELFVNLGAPGSLQAIGTAASPIVFTANASTTPGTWTSLYLGNANATAESRFEHVIVEYGGSTAARRGAVHVIGRSPAFDQVTFRNNLFAGLAVEYASASVTGCTFHANTGAGVEVMWDGTLTIANSTFTNNTAHALLTTVNSVLVDGSGLTASGQPAGRNAISIAGGTLAASRTWPKSLPYAILGAINVHGSLTPTLTIAAGAVVKFEPGAELVVNHHGAGTLQAVGTAADPIVLTSNAATPAPGSWTALYLGGASLTLHNLHYVTVEYAGSSGWGRGGVHVAQGRVHFDHVTFRNNVVAGLTVTDGSTVSGTDCAFIGNTAGIKATGTFSADMRRAYWNTVDGPSGSGFGTGESVSANVLFEPWLTAPPTVPYYITHHELRDRTFNPSIGASANLLFATPSPGDWTLVVSDAAGTILRTVTGTGASNEASWDGRDSSGTVQVDGNYAYRIESTNGAATAAPLRGRMVIDHSKALTVDGTRAAPLFFSPNADGNSDTTLITAVLSYDSATWTITVKDATGATVRSGSGTSGPVGYSWDGKDTSGASVPDGLYTFDVVAELGLGSASGSASATVDNTPPVASITTPAATATLSNLDHSDGSTLVPVIGTATDAHLTSWQLTYNDGSGTSSGTIATGSTPITAAELGQWQTRFLRGTYTVHLSVSDSAGNNGTATITPKVENFTASQGGWEFNARAGQTVTYHSEVPFTCSVKLLLRDTSGQLVRTLFDGSRGAGVYTDVWDGRNDHGALVADGAYLLTANVSDGSRSMLWDQSFRMKGGTVKAVYPPGIDVFDPFNNKYQTIVYTLDAPYRVNLGVSKGTVFHDDCRGIVCIGEAIYKSTGSHVFIWTGTGADGAFLPDYSYVNVIYRDTNFPVNAVVVYGTAPTLTNPFVAPALYNPENGLQSISADLATPYSEVATISVAFINQGSLSTLRTVQLPDQAPGRVTVTWDGRADNGMLVAPGHYTAAITATDVIGNRVTVHSVMTVRY